VLLEQYIKLGVVFRTGDVLTEEEEERRELEKVGGE